MLPPCQPRVFGQLGSLAITIYLIAFIIADKEINSPSAKNTALPLSSHMLVIFYEIPRKEINQDKKK